MATRMAIRWCCSLAIRKHACVDRVTPILEEISLSLSLSPILATQRKGYHLENLERTLRLAAGATSAVTDTGSTP